MERQPGDCLFLIHGTRVKGLGNVVDVQFGGRYQIQRCDFVEQQIGNHITQFRKGVFVKAFL